MNRTFDAEILEILRNAIQEDETFDHTLFERVVVFSCLGVHFGISYKDVFEILRTKELAIYKVPRTRVGILGMINLRGDILPIVDFKARYLEANCDITCETTPTSEISIGKKDNRIIIATTKDIRFGLYVEQVLGMMSLTKANFKTEYIPIIEFSADYQGKPIYILKLDELF